MSQQKNGNDENKQTPDFANQENLQQSQPQSKQSQKRKWQEECGKFDKMSIQSQQVRDEDNANDDDEDFVPKQLNKLKKLANLEKSQTFEKKLSSMKNQQPNQNIQIENVETTPIQTTPIHKKKYNQATTQQSLAKSIDTSITKEEAVKDSIPWWATVEQRKDKQGFTVDHPDYDNTSLHVPHDEFKKLTPAMQQYWSIKSENLDKVIFFKLGKFYELFYDDAILGNKLLDLSLMAGKLHAGFPEKCLEKYATQLVHLGYKIAVVEQTETPSEMTQRLAKERKENKKVSNKTIRREIIQIITIGTSSQQDSTMAQCLLSLHQMNDDSLAFCLLDSTTSQITLGTIEHDEHFTQFKRFVSIVRPVEVLYELHNLSEEIKSILKNAPVMPVFSMLPNTKNEWHTGVAYNKIEATYGECRDSWPKVLNEYYDSRNEINGNDGVFTSLAGLFTYLEQILILPTVLPTARYYKFDPKSKIQTNMLLDSQALQHLEILEKTGSLFSYLNRTASPFGERLLKRWVCAPLLNIEQINERLNAIEDLQQINNWRDQFQVELKRIPDIERTCSRIYQYSIKSVVKAVYFEDISSKRIKELKQLLSVLINAENLISRFQRYSEQFSSQRLVQLVTHLTEDQTIEEEEDIFYGDQLKSNPKMTGMLPHIQKNVQEINDMILWKKGEKGEDIPYPVINLFPFSFLQVQGILESYDKYLGEVDEIKQELNQYLHEVQQQLKDKTISYTHCKYRYELEVPEHIVRGTKKVFQVVNIQLLKPQDFEFTSKRQGFERFRTQEIKDFVSKLEDAELKLKKEQADFSIYLFKKFYEFHPIWNRLIAILSELDCLSTLSLVSFVSDGIMTRPMLVEHQGIYLDFKDARHPCVAGTGNNFIPNDVKLGSDNIEAKSNYKNEQFLLLLTGPNMGGKSTILRTTCLISIMAQLGCYVPSSYCTLSPIDRIFTRIGGSDKLMEGKSTFYIEMEETLNIVQDATENSLAIMDELGRGTSTFDGVAIAYSVLKYLLDNVKCRIMFATHYHVLIQEFKMYKEIEFGFMDSIVDEKVEKVIFLYKLVKGVCFNSFGFNVARIVGVSEEIIQIAKEKAQEFDQKMNFQKMNLLNEKFNKYMEMLFQ